MVLTKRTLQQWGGVSCYKNSHLGGALEADLGVRIGSVTDSDIFPPSDGIDLLTLFVKYTYM